MALRRKYEALSGRTPSAAETEVLAQLSAPGLGRGKVVLGNDAAAGRSKRSAHTALRLQLAGPRPEALAHLALTLAASDLSVLFVSPHEGLLRERHHKFSRRVPSRVLAASGGAISEPLETAPPGITWCSTTALAALVTGKESWPEALAGYGLLVIESAESLEANAPWFSPALVRLGRSLASELVHVPALLGSAYHAELSAVRIEEALPTATLIVREAQGQDLSAELEALPRPLLALCHTPAEVDAVFAELSAGQVPVHRYHRGMSRAERARELVRFALPGRRAILVATSGLDRPALPEDAGSLPLDFGRGYARGDLRSIVHLSVPLSLAQYTAELGLLHAGPRPLVDATHHDDEAAAHADTEDEPSLDRSTNERDDEPEDEPERVAVLYFDRTERTRAADLLTRRRPEPAVLLGVHAALGDGPLGLDELAGRLHHTPTTALGALRVLVEAGLVEQVDGAYRLLETSLGELEPWLEVASERTAADAAHHELVWAFALGNGCRTQALGDALGLTPTSNCRCDVCSRTATPVGRIAEVQIALAARPHVAPPRQHAMHVALPPRRDVRGPGVTRAVSRARGL